MMTSWRDGRSFFSSWQPCKVPVQRADNPEGWNRDHRRSLLIDDVCPSAPRHRRKREAILIRIGETGV